ncbi:isocitrate lyase/PEP mutase family protein [Legionella sainthelensi]|uniref:isocitrate lyase/PEP mutase family protein n=1 Tax=Legionella sainthelensi TaxID=28087 RepID=UPI000E207FFF|nr:oxaloacetate decarboxylase [Legionella sainthelensi]
MNLRKTTIFRQYLNEPEILIAPVVYDPLCAKIAEQIGFKAIMSAGYSNSAAYLGVPDIGLMTLSEMSSCIRRIVQAVDIPIFVDGDDGYGNVNNVMRTIREYESAGAAAIFIEDQVAPKRCGHMSGKTVISAEDMVAKIKAALYARNDPDLVIMARTDALAVNGIEDAIARAKLYHQAGADLLFVEAPESIEQMKEIVKEVKAPLMANNLDGGKTPILTARELEELGYAMVTDPVACTYAFAKAVRIVLLDLMKTGTTLNTRDAILSFDEFNNIVGLNEIRELEHNIMASAANFMKNHNFEK